MTGISRTVRHLQAVEFHPDLPGSDAVLDGVLAYLPPVADEEEARTAHDGLLRMLEGAGGGAGRVLGAQHQRLPHVLRVFALALAVRAPLPPPPAHTEYICWVFSPSGGAGLRRGWWWGVRPQERKKLLSEGAPGRIKRVLGALQAGLPGGALQAAWGALGAEQQATLSALLADASVQ